MQSAYKVVVDGYRLGLGTKLDIGLVEENMG
jgi:hypothetical protein